MLLLLARIPGRIFFFWLLYVAWKLSLPLPPKNVPWPHSNLWCSSPPRKITPQSCGGARDPAKELDLPKDNRNKKSQLHNVLAPTLKMNVIFLRAHLPQPHLAPERWRYCQSRTHTWPSFFFSCIYTIWKFIFLLSWPSQSHWACYLAGADSSSQHPRQPQGHLRSPPLGLALVRAAPGCRLGQLMTQKTGQECGRTVCQS